MRRAVAFSIGLHLLVALGFAFSGACPWFDDVAPKMREAVDVNLFRIGKPQGGKTVVAQTPQKASAKVPTVPTTPTSESSTPTTVVAQPVATSAVESVSVVDGDGKTAVFSIAEYAKWVVDHNREPQYPRMARIRGEQGRVMVRVAIKKAGSPPDEVKLEVSSGSELLDQIALETARSWTYPAFTSLQDRIQFVIPYRFGLEGAVQ